MASEFQSGEFISATEITENGDYPVYGGNGLRGYANRYNHEGFYALIGRQGALCGNVNCADGKAYFTEHAVAVQANQCNDTGFLVYLLSRMNLGQYSGQSAQPGLAVSTLKEVETLLPSKHEQYRIGSLLKDLDSLITLHQRMCSIFCFCAHGSRINFASILQGQLRILRYLRPMPKMRASPSALASGTTDIVVALSFSVLSPLARRPARQGRTPSLA